MRFFARHPACLYELASLFEEPVIALELVRRDLGAEARQHPRLHALLERRLRLREPRAQPRRNVFALRTTGFPADTVEQVEIHAHRVVDPAGDRAQEIAVLLRLDGVEQVAHDLDARRTVVREFVDVVAAMLRVVVVADELAQLVNGKAAVGVGRHCRPHLTEISGTITEGLNTTL
ncbi:hypothetical protein LGN07_17315 [Burkholderia cepacia]|uniref:hypothetical protein n=1 Tax=Burkholderia cepacia TaxID=292 RepID=UPI001CF32CB1|nr:hypothetical protein [Burkholderia cepacia]MCA8120484.1 hypothetical protein [Burkholderia cepacia]